MKGKSMFHCRLGLELTLTLITFILITTADIGMGVIYKNVLDDSNAACSLKAAYAMFLVATFGQFFMVCFDTVVLCATMRSSTYCICVCYHMRVIMHFVSFGLLLVGCIIYFAKDREKAGWTWGFAVAAGIFNLLNAVVWVLTQHTITGLKEAGVNVKNLQEGKKHDGSDYE